MNASLFTADYNTHIKIVVVALISAIAIAVVGIKAHVANLGPVSSLTARNGLVLNPADRGLAFPARAQSSVWNAASDSSSNGRS